MSRSLLHPAVPVGKASAAAIAWRFKGELRVTAIVKATFAFAADGAMTRVDPLPIFGDDVHHAKNPTRSVRFTSDLVPYRKRADVLFTGYAYAPSGSSVASMTVRLGLHDGARMVLERALGIRQKGGFKRVPLTWEHAFGGMGHDENPYGEGYGEPDEPEDLNVFDPADPKRPAGFAPLTRNMLSRKRLLGGLPLPLFGPEVVQLPDAFDFDFFQAAPPGQRVDFLRGDEWILLEGLHASEPTFRTRLPGARGAARIHGLADFGIADGRLLAMYADTLHVVGDEQRCTVAWRGTFAVPSEAALASVRIAAGVVLADEPLEWPDASELERAEAAQPSATPPAPSSRQTLTLSDADIESVSQPDFAATLAIVNGARKGATPAAPPLTSSSGAAPVSAPAAPRIVEKAGDAGATLAAPTGAEGPAKTPSRGSGGETLPVASSAARAAKPAALPFVPPKPGSPPAVATPQPARAPARDAGATLPVSSGGEGAPVTLPFRRSPAAAPEPAPEAPEPAPKAAEPPPPEKKPGASPWAPSTATPAPAPPRRAELKPPPPKVDVKNKLYGGKKKI